MQSPDVIIGTLICGIPFIGNHWIPLKVEIRHAMDLSVIVVLLQQSIVTVCLHGWLPLLVKVLIAYRVSACGTYNGGVAFVAGIGQDTVAVYIIRSLRITIFGLHLFERG